MATVDRGVIYLGGASNGIPILDAFEGDGTNAENASAIVNTVFTGPTMDATTVTYDDPSNNGLTFDDAAGDGDTVTYDTGSGPVTEVIDTAVWYRADFTLSDGSVLTNVNVLIFQTPTGETFLTEFASDIDNLTIVSIEPKTVVNRLFGSMDTDRSMDGITVVCFAEGTKIEVPSDLIAVEALKPGHVISTSDQRTSEVKAIYKIENVEDNSQAPVRIEADALGIGMPKETLRLSPQHRVLCRSRLVERMFGVAEVLVPAKRLIGLPGITQEKTANGVSYYHVELEAHDIVVANGAFAESCHPGEQVLLSLPDIAKVGLNTDVPTCRMVPAGKRQKQFVSRLAKSGHRVYDAAFDIKTVSSAA